MLLQRAIGKDRERGNQSGVERKTLTLARAQLQAGDRETALVTLEPLADSTRLAIAVSAARLYVSAGELERAARIAATMNTNLNPEYRAAASYIEGNIRLAEKDYGAAVDALTLSLDRLDSWLAHYDRGRVYAAAGFHAEALGEFELCQRRIGEASALFLDDSPTFSISGNLPYWLGVVKQELGMSSEAMQAFSGFIQRRTGGATDPLVADARSRLQTLQGDSAAGGQP